MTGLKARSVVVAFASSAISVMAFIAPGTASAACSGVNIKGNGSSLQAKAQIEVWSPAFNEKEGGACKTAGKEQVSYESTSSGKGLESWWVGHEVAKYKGFGPGNAFVGTDQPPNEKQVGQILEKGPGGKVLSIPTLQAAVAIVIHLPSGCTATSGKGGKQIKRLALSDETLQGIFAHSITTWGGALSFNKDALVGPASCGTEPITRVVRKEGSGTTAILKKFLFEINKGVVNPGHPGEENWNELAEANKNLSWPEEASIKRAEKGSGVAELVATTPSSIGYANLHEARGVPAFTPAGGGGSGTSIFWAPLQSKGRKFMDPSTNGEENAKAASNCKGETYISLNGSGKQAKFPPANDEALWNEVTASTKQKKSYPLCGFTYDLALVGYSKFSTEPEAPSAAEVETLKNYDAFILSAPEQSALEGNDFLGLPEGKKAGNVLKTSQEGVAKITF
jgi:ABC-type phosphate transport system substrate-binding protein